MVRRQPTVPQVLRHRVGTLSTLALRVVIRQTATALSFNRQAATERPEFDGAVESASRQRIAIARKPGIAHRNAGAALA